MNPVRALVKLLQQRTTKSYGNLIFQRTLLDNYRLYGYQSLILSRFSNQMNISWIKSLTG